MKSRCLALLALFALGLPPASAGTVIELSTEASRPAANDLVQAVVYAEAGAADPAELARRINRDLGEALQLIKGKAGISVKTGNQQTYPVYGKNQRIESWRTRAELLIEARENTAIAELLAQLQQMKLALASLNQTPAPATRAEVEAGATRDAIRAFEKRAALVADTLGKSYRIKHLTIQQGGNVPPQPVLRAARMEMAADAAPIPLAGGESQITCTVSGEIELAD